MDIANTAMSGIIGLMCLVGAVLVLYVGIRLGTEDHGRITENTSTNKVLMVIANKCLGGFYIVGAMLAICIILF